MYEVFLIEQTFLKKIVNIYSPKWLYFNPMGKICSLKLKINQNKMGFRAFPIKN